MKKTMAISAAVLAMMAAVQATHAAGQKFQEAVTVHGSAPHGARGELALTFSAPVSLPGLSLRPGTYIFEGNGSSVVLVRDANGRPYRWLMTIPTLRNDVNKDTSVILDRETAPDAPPRIVAIFAAGENYGREFLYSTR